MRTQSSKIFAFAVLALTCALYAGEPTPNAAKAGMDPERLAGITARMKEFVEKGTIAGAVTLVARHGVVASLEAVGYQDLESKKPMRTDTIFQIRSMTKPMTAVGIMILLEEGRLTLSDPVEKHLPELRGKMMVDRREGDKVVSLKKPSRPFTIRDLLTHTSGLLTPTSSLPYGTYAMRKTLAEAVAAGAQRPLEFEPGTKYVYSDAGFALLGRIIEVVTGQRYERFMEQRIFQPLRMRDTFFMSAPPERWNRIASAYINADVLFQKRLEQGKLEKWYQDIYRRSDNFGPPAAGIYSTASDVAAFHQMMLNGGTYQGSRILSRASVELMSALHTGEQRVVGFAEAGYGLGWMVVGEPRGTLALQSPGSYGHGGYLGTFGWVDPKKDLVVVFMIQRRPLSLEEFNTFVAMANAAILN